MTSNGAHKSAIYVARNFYVYTAKRERDEVQHKNNLEFIEAIRKRGEKNRQLNKTLQCAQLSIKSVYMANRISDFNESPHYCSNWKFSRHNKNKMLKFFLAFHCSSRFYFFGTLLSFQFYYTETFLMQ